MKKTTIKVDGMVCGGCEKRVKNAQIGRAHV